MNSTRAHHIHSAIGLVLGLFLFSASLSCMAEPLDDATRARVEMIIGGYQANQVALDDIAMEGTIRKRCLKKGAEEEDTDLIAFTYVKRGARQRVDLTYSPESTLTKFARGKTGRWVYDGANTLYKFTDSDLAGVTSGDEFHIRSEISSLNTIAKTRTFDDHAGHLEYLLSRGWDPERQTLKVEDVERDGQRLHLVTYTSKRSGTTRQQWWFDPARGFEVVKAVSESDKANGNPSSRRRLWADLTEVAPGVWRPSNVVRTTSFWDRDGAKHSSRVEMTTRRIQSNTNAIDGELFSMKGLDQPLRFPNTPKLQNRSPGSRRRDVWSHLPGPLA